MKGDADPEGEGWLAAEYALGVLTQPERLQAERRARQDVAFAAEMAEWSERLAPLGAAVRPQAPPPLLWEAIERELFPPARASAEASRADAARTPPARAPAARPERGVSAFWRVLALGSSGLLAASLALLAVLAQRPGPAPAMMASVASQNGAALLTAVFDPATGHAMLMPATMAMPEGRVPELWIIPEGKAPISLGLLDPDRPLRLELRRPGMPMGMMKPGAATLAISAEPAGGSPTGQPTGPVLGTGALRSI